ncbi:type II restriction endonuclease [Rhodophyticola porphyridii]|uniref:type II restriction endonuclease n=1 Tax=Rhodophyticola porphyridii TaxID=1852017 RepID=UPI0035CFD6EA
MSGPDKDRYEVGYGKPPKSGQFQKGKSGNPRGRPKGARGLKTDLKAELGERVTITENGRTRKLTKQQLMVKQLTAKAVKGDMRAISKLAEADRIMEKHLLTLEPAISRTQTAEMQAQKLRLVLPKPLHATFHEEQRGWILDVAGFLQIAGSCD